MQIDSSADQSCGDSRPPQLPSTNQHSPGASLRQGIPEFSDLLLACRHHAVMALVLGATMAGAMALLAWVIIRPNYHAEALVRVRESESVIFKPQTSRSEDVAFFRSQAAIVRSHQVLTAAFDDEDVRNFNHLFPNGNRVEWLDAMLRVETQSGPEVISINVQHETPAVAQAFCNAIARAYLSEITQRISSDRELREKRLEQAAVAADLQLDQLWENLNSLAQSVGSDNSESLTIRDQMQFQSYRDYAQQLQSAQLKGNQLQSQLDELVTSYSQRTLSQDEMAGKMLDRHPEVVAARNQLARLDQQRQQMQKIAASPDSPQMKRLTDQRTLLAAELDALISQLANEVTETLKNQVETAHQQSVAKVKYEIELNRSEKEFLRERLTELNSVATRSTAKTVVPLDMTRHAVDRQSRLADGLWTALQELRIEAQSPSRVALQELATLPRQANHSRQLRAAAAGGAGGWMLILFMIGYFEWRDCRVRSPRDLVSRSRFPVFGTNSFMASVSQFRMGIRQKQMSGGVREAATKILLRKQEGADASSLMITSCTATEPRHLVSQEMAVLLGSRGQRVLLIDCDTDQSRLSQILGASQLDGIRQLMSEGKDPTTETINEWVVETNHQEVRFLPIGRADDESNWLDPRTLRRAIDAFRSHFDAIIVNGPSMMGSAESALLADEVETNVIAVFINQSRWNHVMLCEDSACQSGIRLGGSILYGGRGKPDLKLRLNQSKRVSASPPESSRKDPETQLCEDIDELQRDLQRVQTADSDPIEPGENKDLKLKASNVEIND